jgi:hypothetical protein
MSHRFLQIAGVVLLLTACAKLFSAFGSAPILSLHDPILRLPYRMVFVIGGIVELLVGLACIVGRRTVLQAGLLASLATVFITYRIGLYVLGESALCPCLGSLTDAIHLSASVADLGLKITLGALSIGSYAILLHASRTHARSQEPS